MPLYDVRCTACGAEVERWAHWEERALPCGFCAAPTERIWKANAGSRAQVDEWPSGKTFENGFASPQTFFSRSAYHAALKANGMRVRGDGEESATWMSRETLENARKLVTR